MNISLRPCRAADRRGCEELIRDAFWDLYRPGCVEHFVTHRLWEAPELASAILAESDQLDGCLIASRTTVVGSEHPTPVLYLGPLAVRDSLRGQGIGSALMRQALAEGAEQGYPAAFLYGDPALYSRFGFVNAAQLGVSTEDGANFDAFMGVRLSSELWTASSGRLIEPAAFAVDREECERFDATFEPRVKHVRPGQFGQ